jgi:hypothetical protein
MAGGLDLVGAEELSWHRAGEAGIYPVATTKAKANTNVQCPTKKFGLVYIVGTHKWKLINNFIPFLTNSKNLFNPL